MRKIPLPDENRRRSERLTDEKPAVNVLREEQAPPLRIKTELSEEGAGYGFDTFSDTDDGEDLIKKCAKKSSRRGGACSSRGISNEGHTDDGFCDDDCGEEIIKKSAKKSAREYALLLVSTHTYTEKALFQKIGSKKTYTHEEITDAVEYVKKFGYVNDKRLAENMIPKLAERCFGRSKICRYFASKGISEDVIDELDFSEIDFVYYCKRLLDRQTGKPDDKIMRTLLNAGYTYDEIAEAKGLCD